ncbi:hypothetical protein [Sphingomonas sp. TREG-RG-20F-R18-01]|uniref:hypothetical protein n=1 Tax=Sphingomonas sp. TREG-RG-20F-R18-01 TaxID=2914982 RepID=UPI001F57BCBB|nr:hypothetical protein [Sphingomonas sp. TREG-RG-20F-R18-01]
MAVAKVFRSPDFGKRLEQACDQSPHCPPLHKGRLQWIADELKKRFKLSVSTETVRKWMHGESRPKQDKNLLLAQLLQVDPTWLFMGIDADLEPREKRVRNAMADGIVNVIAGFIQIDGGNPAFPAEGDKRAVVDNVDLYAIIKGANYAFHVSLGSDDYRFAVPTKHENVIVLGVMRDGFAIDVFEISEAMIAKGTKRGGSIEVVLDEETIQNALLNDFTKRLP